MNTAERIEALHAKSKLNQSIWAEIAEGNGDGKLTIELYPSEAWYLIRATTDGMIALQMCRENGISVERELDRHKSLRINSCVK